MNDKTDSSTGAGGGVVVGRGQRPHSASDLRTHPSTGRLTGTVRERHAPLRGRVTKQSASCCIARLLVLAAEDPKNPIVAYIDSAGGSAGESLSILSTMNGIRCPIVTFCRGTTGGPAVVIAAHGLRGFRVAAPNTRFSFKDFDFVGRAGKMTGKESFLPLLAEILSEDSHRPKEEFLELLAKGAEFNVQEAIRLGLIDQVSSKPILPPKAA